MSLPKMIAPGAVASAAFQVEDGTFYTTDATGHVTPANVNHIKDLTAMGFNQAVQSLDTLTAAAIAGTLSTTQVASYAASLAPIAALSTTQAAQLAALAPLVLNTTQIASLATIPAPTTTSSQVVYMHADGTLHLGA